METLENWPIYFIEYTWSIMSVAEQEELINLPEHPSLYRFLWDSCCSHITFLCRVSYIIVCYFDFSALAIALSVPFRVMASDYIFGVFRLFLSEATLCTFKLISGIALSITQPLSIQWSRVGTLCQLWNC